jgi:ribonuclease Z
MNNIFYNSAHIDAYLGTYGMWMSRNEQVTGQLLAHENVQKEKGANAQNVQNSDKKKTPKPPKKKLGNDEINEKDRSMKLWGPPGFSNNFKHVKHFFFKGADRFVNEYDFKNKVFMKKEEDNSTNPIEFFEDENLKIHPICTLGNSDIEEEKIIPDSNIILAENKNFKNLNKNNFAMSYICEPHLRAPPFLVEKAKALGLKPGPSYALLQKGQSVFLDNGVEIKPSDVLGKQSPSPCVGIFYSPTINHALNLTKHEIIQKFSEKSDSRIFSLIVHIVSDTSILEKDFYKKFISQFGEDTIHIIDCKETNFKFMLNEEKHKLKVILNKIDSHLFKNNLFSEEDTLPKKDIFNVLDSDFILKNKIIQSSPGFEYILYPIHQAKVKMEKIYFDPFIHKNSEMNQFNEEIDKIISNLKEGGSWIDDIKSLSHKIEPQEKFENNFDKSSEPEIIFLGTTSMKPGKQRNVSAILVKLSEKFKNYSMLLDCGEGTFQQIFDHYGNKLTDQILSKLKLIFITHKHGDHMLGLLKVLSEIDILKSQHGLNPLDSPNVDTVIYVIAPTTILKWIKLSIENDLIYFRHIILIDCAEVNPNLNSVYKQFIWQKNPLQNFSDVDLIKEKREIQEKITDFQNLIKFKQNKVLIEFYDFINQNLGINFYSIEVFHCDESYGCFLEEYKLSGVESTEFKPWKISYSGDTRPCNNFSNYAYDSTVFIHEATFEDELQKDAEDKMHSTFEEAICLGKENKSWNVVLTHFSPRYAKFVTWNSSLYDRRILLSHDFLSVNISDLEWAYCYNKNLSAIMEILDKKEKVANEEKVDEN